MGAPLFSLKALICNAALLDAMALRGCWPMSIRWAAAARADRPMTAESIVEPRCIIGIIALQLFGASGTTLTISRLSSL